MANELDPLSNVVAIIDYCRTAGTSPDLDVLAELLAKIPTSHPNPDKCCPDCVREKQMAVAAMNEAIDAAKPKAGGSPEKWDAGDRAVMTQLRGAPTAEGGKMAGLMATLAEMEHGEGLLASTAWDCEPAEEHCECGLDTARYFAQQAAAEHAAEVERLKIRIGNEVARAVKAETTLVPREEGNRYLTEAIAVFEDVGNAGMLSPKLALSKLLGTIDLLRSAKDSHNNSWFTVEDIASGSSFSCKHGNVNDPLVISLRSDVMRVRADLAELRQIDAALARRPALDKPTRYENIVHAITTAGDATDKANRYLSDIKAILSLLGVDVAEVNWTEPSVYATAQKAWHEVTNATVLARGERDAAQAKLLAVRQAWP